MPKRLKFVVEQWVLFMVRRQTWQARIIVLPFQKVNKVVCDSKFRNFRIGASLSNRMESWRPIRIRIESRSFAGPYLWRSLAGLIFLRAIGRRTEAGTQERTTPTLRLRDLITLNRQNQFLSVTRLHAMVERRFLRVRTVTQPEIAFTSNQRRPVKV